MATKKTETKKPTVRKSRKAVKKPNIDLSTVVTTVTDNGKVIKDSEHEIIRVTNQTSLLKRITDNKTGKNVALIYQTTIHNTNGYFYITEDACHYRSALAFVKETYSRTATLRKKFTVTDV